MDAKKIIGVSVIIALIVVLGYAIVRQMSSMPSSSVEEKSSRNLPGEPIKSGLSEEPQDASVPDTRQPATVDVIVGDIEAEAEIDRSAMEGELSGEASILGDEESSLNEVSQFYDEKSL
jgi:hypothetical protein